MQKFLITRRSHKRRIGPILVTTSPRVTCPESCAFRKGSDGPTAGACYAEHGFIGGFIWTKLDQLPVGGSFKQGQIRIYSLEELTAIIRELEPGSLWRHNQAGDLYANERGSIDERVLGELTAANEGRLGFTFTHNEVLDNMHNRRMVKEANDRGFTINLSANSPDHADQLASLDIAPIATLIPSSSRRATQTRAGRRISTCPAT